MTPHLSEDVEKFVSENPTGAVKIEGSNGTFFWVLTEEAMQVRQYVQEGLAEADRGECTPFDADEIKRAGRKLLAQRNDAS
jgi:hypothetical protein